MNWSKIVLSLALVSDAALLFAQSGSIFTMPKCTPLPIPLQMHGSVVARNRVYVLGGNNNSGWVKAVYSADIHPDGLLGSWREETAMPDYRAYLGNNVVSENNYIYVVGGITATSASESEAKVTRSRDVVYAEVLPDGTIAEWKRSAPFGTDGLSNSAVCSSNQWLYVLGGKIGTRDVTDKVYAAPLRSDGGIGDWKQSGRLPAPLWFHGAASVGGRIYTWAGSETPKLDSPNNRVFSAGQSSDGSLTGWITEHETLPQPMAGAPCRGSRNMLIAVGGRYGSAPSRDIWISPVAAGETKPWRKVQTDLDGNVYHALALDEDTGRVYVSGGQNKSENKLATIPHVQTTVQALQLEAPRK